MAYYYRRQNYSSGRGDSDIYYWPDSGENDVFSILKPFVALAGCIFKIPFFRNVIGFVVGLPIAIILFILIMTVMIGLWLVREMFDCWGKILDTYAHDLKAFVVWVFRKVTRKDAIVMTDPSV